MYRTKKKEFWNKNVVKHRRSIFAKNKTVFMRFIECNILLDISTWTSNVHFMFSFFTFCLNYSMDKKVAANKNFIGLDKNRKKFRLTGIRL